MKGSWVGQLAGVGWGVPTEFEYLGRIVPEAEMPRWTPEMVNQFAEDDLYVEMTFLRTLELHGLDVSIRQAGIDFANSRYPLWHANKQGRNNLRAGIAPPDSGHPQFNPHADDIDYQIESDFSGLISPGMPNRVIALGNTFGHLMNHGDGVYGGQFIGGMYAEAFFESDIEKIIAAGLACIPAQSQYHECVCDVLAWYHQHPNDWVATWRRIDEKYHRNLDYRRASCGKEDFNIDAKINGAYVLMGLLYGGGDPDRTITIATRCGQDSDCNPSSAAGVLFTIIGYDRVPDRFKSRLEMNTKFSFTPYDFTGLVEVCSNLARASVVHAGGHVESTPEEGDVFVIPVRDVHPIQLEQSWAPQPASENRYSDAERAQISD
ncbi:MAG: ADP-ribosylglycohydrolase family protein [Pirellulales bacterium]